MPKIKAIEYFRVKPRWLFVKITDAEDKAGWGEATLEGHSLAVEGALDEIITRILGYEAELARSNLSVVSRQPCSNIVVVISSTSGRRYGAKASTVAVLSSCPPFRVLTLHYGI